MQAEDNIKLLEIRKERDTLKTLNDSLLQNTQAFQKQTKQAQGEAEEAKARVVELEEQVCCFPQKAMSSSMTHSDNTPPSSLVARAKFLKNGGHLSNCLTSWCF